MIKQIVVLGAMLVFFQGLNAQDPHFTQFYSAPLSVNPAYTGVFDGKLRFISNFRRQWSSLSSSFATTTVSLDGKIRQNDNNVQNAFNWGIQFMNDQSMKGAFRSNYFTGTASYHKGLDKDGFKSLGMGVSVTYGDRRVDFSSTSFESQFTSGGFDLALPNGEASLGKMKPFVTIGAGLLYAYNNADNGTFFDLGVSIYHLNRPKQSFLSDKYQYLPMRYSAQISFQYYVSDDLFINVKSLYQNQATVQYLLGGVSVAKLLGDEKDNMVGAGVWYRTGDAVSPYVFLEFSKIQLGITYDATVSNLKQGPKRSSSLEFSLQWRLAGKRKGIK